MTMEGFSVDQCVAKILCGETMELEGVEMAYNCFDNAADSTTSKNPGAASRVIASLGALAAVAYAM